MRHSRERGSERESESKREEWEVKEKEDIGELPKYSFNEYENKLKKFFFVQRLTKAEEWQTCFGSFCVLDIQQYIKIYKHIEEEEE